jgi:hypothetical protein
LTNRINISATADYFAQKQLKEVVMSLMDYQVIIIDCDGILINSHQGILSKIYQLRQDLPQNQLTRQSLIQHFDACYYRQTPRIPELGFCALHALTYQQVLAHYSLKTHWKEMLHFARSANTWPRYADAWGAVQYLRKFFRVIVRCDRDIEDLPTLRSGFDLPAEEILIRTPDPHQIQQYLESQGISPQQSLMITTPALAKTFEVPNIHCIERGFIDPPDTRENLAALVIAHQSALRQSGTNYA